MVDLAFAIGYNDDILYIMVRLSRFFRSDCFDSSSCLKVWSIEQHHLPKPLLPSKIVSLPVPLLFFAKQWQQSIR